MAPRPPAFDAISYIASSQEETQACLSEATTGKKKGKKEESSSAPAAVTEKRQTIKVVLEFKKYVYGDKKKIVQ